MAASRAETRTGGRPATTGTIGGNLALSVGMPDKPAPEGWRWTRLTDVARLETGHTPSRKRPEYWEGEIPWIGIKDATGNHGRKIHDTIQHTNQLGIANSSARILPENTVCLSRTASVGYVVVMGRPMATSQDFVNWVCSKNLDSQFLKYVLLGERSAFLRFASGTTHQTIYFPEVKAFHVCLPPLSEQRAIAHILGTLDDKIELNRRMNETLEAMARALFKSWFVDFDPVRAKMAGRDPGLPKHIANLFPGRLVDSELGEIPEGWEVTTLGECFDVARGLSYKGSKLSSNGLKMHNLNSIHEGGGYKYEGLKYYKGDYKPRHVVHPDEVIVANTEQGHNRLLIGYAAIIPKCHDEKNLFSHHLFRIRPRPSLSFTADYIYHLLNTRATHDLISGYATGTTVNMLPLDALRLPKITVPSVQVVATFSKVAEMTRERQEKISQESPTLAALRGKLLHKLISGEICIREAEKAVEAVV